MFELLDNWLLESAFNFNILVTITAFLYISAFVTLIIVWRKIGRPDERTNHLHLKIISFMFFIHILFNAIYISLIADNMVHSKQFFILFQGLVFFLGAINAIRLYKKIYS